MSIKRGELHVGTSGYQYDHWKGVFYPEDIPKKRWFEHYAANFETVEINNTFYNLPKEQTFANWAENAPDGFCYAVKYSRYGSHIKRLKDPADHVGKFVERVQKLGKHLGPILVQLPPRWNVDPPRLEGFLKEIPRRYRWTIELRDTSWLCGEVFDLLRKYKAALCIHDMIEGHPQELTADWVYLRFHGTEGKYGGSYPHQALSAWAGRIGEYLDEGRDVYAYFNNDQAGYAVSNAADLRRYVLKRD